MARKWGDSSDAGNGVRTRGIGVSLDEPEFSRPSVSSVMAIHNESDLGNAVTICAVILRNIPSNGDMCGRKLSRDGDRSRN